MRLAVSVSTEMDLQVQKMLELRVLVRNPSSLSHPFWASNADGSQRPSLTQILKQVLRLKDFDLIKHLGHKYFHQKGNFLVKIDPFQA